MYLEAICILARKADFKKKPCWSKENIFKTFVSPLKPVVLRYAEVCGYFHQGALLLKVKDYKDTAALTAVIQMLQHQSVTAMLDAKQVVSRMAQIKIYTHVNVHMYPKMDHYYF